MTGAQLDAIKQAEDMRIWEEMNKEDPKAKKAAELLGQAVQLLEKVEYLLSKAVVAVGDEGETDRIYALNNDAEELEIAVRMQIGRMK